MDNSESSKNRIKIILLILLMLFVIVAGTFAWFTMRQVNTTDTVSAKTSEADVALYISSKGGSDFKKTTVADIVQLNDANKEELMPVSTSDLNTFIYSPSTKSNKVSTFAEDTKGNLYYKGCVYIKAESKNTSAGNKMDLYLDTSEGSMVEAGDDSKEILNACRLGLSLDDGDSPVIMYISDESNPSSENQTTTVIDGVEYGDGYVLTKSSGKIVAIKDPSVKYDKYAVNIKSETPVMPDKPLMTIELNKIYKLNVYYYLEGCDKDCNADIQEQETEMHVSLFGVLS